MNPTIARRLITATTVKDLVEILDQIQASGTRVAWKPVGGNDNNLAIINLGSDPAAGVIERVTNAVDAVLEQAWVEKGQPPHLTSPRLAVEKWFDIKEGKLGKLKREYLQHVTELRQAICRNESFESNST